MAICEDEKDSARWFGSAGTPRWRAKQSMEPEAHPLAGDFVRGGCSSLALPVSPSMPNVRAAGKGPQPTPRTDVSNVHQSALRVWHMRRG
jgi:hypothetical protein